MQLKLSLLAGLLLFLSADALPRPRTNFGIVTLPLKHIEQRSDAHPQIVSNVFIVSQHSSNDQLPRSTNKILTAAIAAMRE